jgi:hypothetical protein
MPITALGLVKTSIAALYSLLCNYLLFALQLYINKNPPRQREIMSDNLPGRHKKPRIEAENITTVNLTFNTYLNVRQEKTYL